MRLMIKIILYFLFQTSLYSSFELELNLRDFASLVSDEKQINILLNPDINATKNTFIISNSSSHDILNVFKKMLSYNNLLLIKDKGFYYVDYIKDNNLSVSVENVYQVSLDNLVFNDVNNYLSAFDINSTYLKGSNTIVFKSTKKNYKQISKFIKKIDLQSKQVTFKINVLETSLDDLKDRGFNLSAYYKTIDDKNSNLDLNYFLNLITMPYTATSNVLQNSKSGFYAVLKFLNQNGYTNIKTSPFLTAKNNKQVIFTSVQNIPYLLQSTSQKKDETTTTNSYEYKDVGLKLAITPYILKNEISFDLSLELEDILVTSLTPTISKKTLSSSYSLKRGDLLVLSGINKDTFLDTSFGIPFLQDIFIIGNLFKFSSKKKYHTTLTISIEVI